MRLLPRIIVLMTLPCKAINAEMHGRTDANPGAPAALAPLRLSAEVVRLRHGAVLPALCLAVLWLALWNAALCAGDALPPDTFAAPCAAWTPVNAGAFGMGTGGDGSYSNEEGFEVVVFDGRLYVGMEADNDYGSRLWRTKAGVRVPSGQANWEEVAAVDGEPFGNDRRQGGMRQNDHIDSLAAFHGAIYASNANGGESKQGALVYRSATGDAGSWIQVNAPGFGDVNNTNFKDMVVFTVGETDWLCGGTMNGAAGAQVWCTADGAAWTQKNLSGFGVVSNVLIASSEVFSGALYFGVYNPEGGSVWRTADLVTWSPVFTAPDRARVEMVGGFDGDLYIAAGAYDGRIPSDPAIRLYRSAAGDPGAWSEVGAAVGSDPHNTRTIVDGATVYNGGLYVAVMNAATGAEVWRTTEGVTWTQVNADGFGAAATFAAQLIPFNGYLYAWTSNYVGGQQVLRTVCPICQAQAIAGAGRYDFSGVGATITLTAGTPAVITVCVTPDAPPTVQAGLLPVARTCDITAAPATVPFTADLTLAYTAAELAASNIITESTLYLARWDGSAWIDCPLDRRARSAVLRTVTCRDVTSFSTWAITGEGGVPLRVGVIVANRPGSYAGPWLLVFLGFAILATFLKLGSVKK